VKAESAQPLPILKFVAHGKRVISLAGENGWRPGARYTNLRDVKHVRFEGVGFLDIHWKKYCFSKHVAAARITRPYMTVARDIECMSQLSSIIAEARELLKFSTKVIVVPKDIRLEGQIESVIPAEFVLGYSVPTRYGGTKIHTDAFQRNVHLLGGRPDVQRKLAHQMPVISFDCNRFTLDAGFGDYFDGSKFKPHPEGGYEACLLASITNINAIWLDYSRPEITEEPQHG
jgi:hypothetical protein